MKRMAIMTLVCLLALPSISFGKGPGGLCGLKMPHGRWWHRPEVVAQLKLTSQEQEKLNALFVESERELIDLRGNVQKQELELKTLLDQEDFNQSACADQFGKLLEARSGVARERFSFHMEVRKLLGLERYRELLVMFRDHRRHCMHGEASPDELEQGSGVQQ